MAQAIVYLACAPKSNAVYTAFKAAMRDAAENGSQEVPLHLRNAPTRLMKELGYGSEYRYAHDEPDAYAAGEDYFPETMEPRRYYHPVPRGTESKIRDKLEHLALRSRKPDPRRRNDPHGFRRRLRRRDRTLLRFALATGSAPNGRGISIWPPAVNLLGCLLIGYLYATFLARPDISPELRGALIIGFLAHSRRSPVFAGCTAPAGKRPAGDCLRLRRRQRARWSARGLGGSGARRL